MTVLQAVSRAFAIRGHYHHRSTLEAGVILQRNPWQAGSDRIGMARALSVWLLAFASAAPASAYPLVSDERVGRLLDSASAEIPKLVTYLLFLGAGWYIGRRLTLLWSFTQKQREQDLAAAGQFHVLYGEFFAVWKLWNYFIRRGGASVFEGASRWSLLDRAAQAEAKLEAILVRLASEKRLTTGEIEILGKFRQLYQKLRESIRDNEPLDWDSSEHPRYLEFKKLAPQVAAIITGQGAIQADVLRKITSNIYEDEKLASERR